MLLGMSRGKDGNISLMLGYCTSAALFWSTLSSSSCAELLSSTASFRGEIKVCSAFQHNPRVYNMFKFADEEFDNRIIQKINKESEFISVDL